MQGRFLLKIYAVKLSINADQDSDKAKVLILGQCHAEEIYGVESLGSVKALLHAGGVLASALSPLIFGYLIDWGFGILMIVTISISIILFSTLLPLYKKLP